MASGVAVNDECVTAFSELKMGHKLRYVMYRISDDNTEIVVDKTGKPNSTFEDFCKELVPEICRYAIFDLEFVTKEGAKRDKVVFFAWAPDTAKVKDKMMYASSKDALKKKLVGIGKEFQCSDMSDINLDKIVDDVAKSSKG